MDFLVFAALFLATIYLANSFLMNRWSRRGFAQLNPKFIVGDIGKLLSGKQSIAVFLHEKCLLTKDKRALGLYFSLRPNLLINDPVLIQDILVRDFNNFHDRPFYVNEVKNPLTGHLFSLAGQKWRDLRVKLTPAFTTGKLKGMFPIIKYCAKVLEDYLQKNVDQGKNEVELADLFSRYTTNMISSVAFGIENDCINKRDHIFYRICQKISMPSFKKGFSDILAMFVPFISIRAVDQEVEDFIFSIVKQNLEYREKNDFSRKDFMQLMVELKNQGFVSSDKENEGKDSSDVRKMKVSEIAAQVFVFIIAGTETSSATMHYCMYELAKHPEIQRKVQQEIDGVLKSTSIEDLTYENMHEMKYLECCIDETLRKYPFAATLFRKCKEDYQVKDSNLVIPKGTTIFISAMAQHRDPLIYENPIEFKPERFESSSTGGGKSKGLFYLPFGDGPRNCIGMRLGKVTMKIGLALLLSKFNFELSNASMNDQEMKFHPSKATLSPSKAFNFTLTSR